MPRAQKGLLVECDPATRQLLISLNKTMSFIIEFLDETHLFVDQNKIEVVQRRLEEELEENTYKFGEDVR